MRPPLQTYPPWMGRQRKKPAESKAQRLERVAAEMRAKRSRAQIGAVNRWEHRITLNALATFAEKPRAGEQGADIWPLRPARDKYEEML